MATLSPTNQHSTFSRLFSPHCIQHLLLIDRQPKRPHNRQRESEQNYYLISTLIAGVKNYYLPWHRFTARSNINPIDSLLDSNVHVCVFCTAHCVATTSLPLILCFLVRMQMKHGRRVAASQQKSSNFLKVTLYMGINSQQQQQQLYGGNATRQKTYPEEML